jgi:hypothetical protein
LLPLLRLEGFDRIGRVGSTSVSDAFSPRDKVQFSIIMMIVFIFIVLREFYGDSGVLCVIFDSFESSFRSIRFIARESLGIDISGHVIVVDEAHNLIETINSLYSEALTEQTLSQVYVCFFLSLFVFVFVFVCLCFEAQVFHFRFVFVFFICLCFSFSF